VPGSVGLRRVTITSMRFGAAAALFVRLTVTSAMTGRTALTTRPTRRLSWRRRLLAPAPPPPETLDGQPGSNAKADSGCAEAKDDRDLCQVGPDQVKNIGKRTHHTELPVD
jgi:hypothetical protein